MSNEEYMLQFNRKAAAQRIPLSGSIDLTHRCNLRCVHCYLGGKTQNMNTPNPELTTAQWIRIIDEIAEAGCLNLLITGGEPFLKAGFAEIYTRARENGLIVTVFTNGSRITDDILALFKDLPPHAVEISLYGATLETYERITGIKGSYRRCINGIEKLLDHNINLKLKTVLLVHNHHEFYDIKTMAEKNNVTFRFDAAIFPTIYGDKTPVRLRVSPKEAVEIELSDKNRLKEWRDFFCKVKDLPRSDFLYICGAGLTSFHIDPYGNLQPCLMITDLKYNLLKGNFREGWQDVVPGIRQRKADRDFACNQCEKMVLCGYCPAFFKLEKGAEDVSSEYLCVMGHHRFQAIDQLNGDSNAA